MCAVPCLRPGFGNGSTCIVGAGTCAQLAGSGGRTCFTNYGETQLAVLGGSAPAVIGRVAPRATCPSTPCPSGTALIQLKVGPDLAPFFTSGIPTVASGRVASAQACRDRAAFLRCGTESPRGFFIFIPGTGEGKPCSSTLTPVAQIWHWCRNPEPYSYTQGSELLWRTPGGAAGMDWKWRRGRRGALSVGSRAQS